jgi:nucleotide-binding universal stress UspA family protein
MSSQTSESREVVLIALDGSLAAAMALPIASAVAAQIGADCQALHIISDAGPGADLSRQLAKSVGAWTGIELWRDVVGPIVQLWQVFAAPGNAILKAFWHIEVRLDFGDPVAGILRANADPKIVLVVLTTHGHVIEPGRTLGRVAEQVIADATRPILLVRPEAESSKRGMVVRRLLLPLDGTPTTAMLLNPACELAGRLGAALDLLYVASAGQPHPDEPGSISAPLYVDQPQHEWPQWALEVIDRLSIASAGCPPNVTTRTFLVQGDAASEIPRFAAEWQSDVVVLARRSHLEPDRAQVLRAVLDGTPCPVLLVGEPASAPQDN